MASTRILSQTKIPLLLLLGVLLSPPARLLMQTDKTLRACYLFAVSFLMCFLLVPVMTRIGELTGLVDHPNEARKQHKTATPLTGGMALYAAFAATILLNFDFSYEMKAILVASGLIFLTGLLDDRLKLSAHVRLFVQVAASLFLVLFGVRVTFVPDWLGGVYVETLITLIWLVGITNSMNFIDGMDGLAAGTGVICCSFFALTALLAQQWWMMYLAIAVAGSSMGFLPYNFRLRKPALIFLGDSGSTFLGFLLASLAILGEWGESIVDLTVPVLIMSVLIFDMALTTIVRIVTGEVRGFSEWIHYTGRDHFHHRLTGLGLGRVQATAIFYLVSISFGLEALVVLFADIWVSVLVLVHTVVLFCVFGIILVIKKDTGHAATQFSPDTDS